MKELVPGSLVVCVGDFGTFRGIFLGDGFWMNQEAFVFQDPLLMGYLLQHLGKEVRIL